LVYSGFGYAGLRDISCPSAHLCAAAAGPSGELLTSTNPSGGRAAWRGAAISPGLNENIAGELDFVACAFTTLCVAADNLGHVYTSTHPTGPVSAWRAASFELADVSCPSSSLCVAIEGGGEARLGTP